MLRFSKHLAEMVAAGEVDLATMDTLSDEDIVASLTRIKGIGRWSAEMFMIFSLGRQDILSGDDAGLKRAIQWLDALPELPGKEISRQIGKAWKPCRTAASLYLWEATNRDLTEK